MAKSYKLRVENSAMYGVYARVDFEHMSSEEMYGLRKEVQQSVLAFRPSDDGQSAFLELLVGAGHSADAVVQQLGKLLEKMGYTSVCEKI